MAVPLTGVAIRPDGIGGLCSSTYAERPWRGPGPVGVIWVGHPGWSPRSLLLLPDGCVDLVWDGVVITVVPPRGQAVRHQLTARGPTVGVRLRPGWAGHVLRADIGSLPDVSELATVRDRGFGPVAALAAEREPAGAARLLARWVATALGSDGSSPEPHLLHAIDLLRQPGSSVRTAAAAAGYSARELHRLFVAHVGLAPKTFQRVTRFQRFRGLFADPAPDLTLAWAAAICGYADQAHLAHDCRDFTGRTPTALAVLAAVSRPRGRATRLPD